MDHAPLTGYRRLALALLLLLLASCQPQPEAPKRVSRDITSSRLPQDCNAAIDTFITQQQMRTDPDKAIRAFNRLAHKYRNRDTMAYASMRAYVAQAWDVKGEGDSIVDACEDALAYFDEQQPYLDMRSMCHLYMGWGYYYKKNQLTANYFFSLAGNDMTDTVYIPRTKQYVTSNYPPATKAALLEEIASMARVSGLNVQAKRYIALARQSLALMPNPDGYLRAFIYIESGSTYSRLKQFDSAAYYLNLVAADTAQIKIPIVYQTYLIHRSEYFMDLKQYDSAIAASLAYQRAIAADSTADKENADAQLITLARAYTAKGLYRKADALLDHLEAALGGKQEVIAGSRISYLEARAANQLAAAYGASGNQLVEQYAAAKEQLYDQQRLAAITDMDARYKTRRREEAIRRLNMDNKAYARKTRRQSKLLVITVLSLLLVAAVGVIIYQRQARLALQAKVDRMQLEQRLLRSQMEPHFIFNTLAVLQGLIRRNDRDLSIKYLNQFARLLRISLEHARESFVPLSGEVDALGHYLGLQQLRFQDAFTYRIETWEGYEEDSPDLLIPPMMLQPFAENAVQHGMKGYTGGAGHIHIQVTKAAHSIRFVIEDNGTGFDTTAPPARGKKPSLATVITRERLAMLSKTTQQPSGLTITSAVGAGTRVELEIPYRLQSVGSANEEGE